MIIRLYHHDRPKRLAEQNTVVAVSSSKDDGEEGDLDVPGVVGGGGSTGEDPKLRQDTETARIA